MQLARNVLRWFKLTGFAGMWVSIILYTMKLHCVSTNTNTEHSALCVTKNAYVCHVATAGLHWTSHSTVLFFKFNPCNRWLHYRGFTFAPCDVSLAMFSLNHRIVRLMIDMLLHSYMHRWKNSLFRLQVRVQLVLGGLVLILLHCSLWNTDLQLGNKKWWQTNAVKACILHNTRAIWPLPSSSFNLP